MLSKLSNEIAGLALLGSSNSHHKELASAHVGRDKNDFLEILTWFLYHNPFTASEKLTCLGSGLTKTTQSSVNWDKLETSDVRILKSLDN